MDTLYADTPAVLPPRQTTDRLHHEKGRGHGKWGEVVAAYVQPRPGLTVDTAALEALCARSLSGYKRPTAFFVVEEIPKNAVGRIDKISVRAAHAAASAGA
ncbi:hypothetical protein ACFP51_11200 [Streptomyces pratens]|uniref:AMP-binding enzyme C-terminal domain-containing protein n=1 Tax=Streptomyces pratens TaxID=887456 RepID=A0ABW1M4A5_9ACTN